MIQPGEIRRGRRTLTGCQTRSTGSPVSSRISLTLAATFPGLSDILANRRFLPSQQRQLAATHVRVCVQPSPASRAAPVYAVYPPLALLEVSLTPRFAATGRPPQPVPEDEQGRQQEPARDAPARRMGIHLRPSRRRPSVHASLRLLRLPVGRRPLPALPELRKLPSRFARVNDPSAKRSRFRPRRSALDAPPTRSPARTWTTSSPAATPTAR